MWRASRRLHTTNTHAGANTTTTKTTRTRRSLAPRATAAAVAATPTLSAHQTSAHQARRARAAAAFSELSSQFISGAIGHLLRDANQTGPPAAMDPVPNTINHPLPRRWLALEEATASSPSPASAANGVSFTVVSYNMLAQSLVRRDLFPYCSSSALKVSLRKDRLLAELRHLNADIICMQEVDRAIMDQFWRSKLAAIGYTGEWAGRTSTSPHGCAIFYKSAKFSVFALGVLRFADVVASPYVDLPDNLHEEATVRKASVFEEMNRPNVAMIAGLRVKQATGATSEEESLGFYVTNTHLFWDPRYRFVRLKQCQALLDRVATLQTTKGTLYPTVLAGDWNVTPDNIIYKYLTQRGEIDQNEAAWNQFLTPAEHGAVFGEDSSPTPPVPQAELDANSGVSSASLAKMVQAVSLGSSSSSASSQLAPLSNKPIHQLRSELVRQPDGSLKEVAVEPTVDHTTDASRARLAEVQEVLRHSRQLPLLRSVYAEYTRVVPADARASVERSQQASFCRWTGEAPFTNYTEKFRGTLDYLFVPVTNPTVATNDTESVWNRILASPLTLRATHVLEIPTEEAVSGAVGLPNDTLASDHISIAARFVLARNEAAAVTTEPSALAKVIAASLSSPVSPAPTSSASSSSSSSLFGSHASFSVPRFESLLRTKYAGRPLHYAASVTSTMDLCKDALFGGRASSPTPGTLWLAEEQTKGRGRVEGRVWASPKNVNISATLLMQLHDLPFDVLRVELTKINQSVCLSVAEAIESNLAAALGVSTAALPAPMKPKIKWPNDVWVGGRKCCGVLIDSEMVGRDVNLVIGFGVNVLADMRVHDDPALRDTATSVQQALAMWVEETAAPIVQPITREAILASFLQAFETHAAASAASVRSAYERFDMLVGRLVTVMPKKKEDTTTYYDAQAIGYSPDGYLIVQRTPDGPKLELVAEEVSIRPANV